MICLDTMVLIWGLQKSADPDYQHFIERTERYLKHLDEENATIMIPSPVIAEYLQGFDSSGRAQQLVNLQKLFFIPSFDLPSAALAAELTDNSNMQNVRRTSSESRQALKVDVLIAAIAIIHGATHLITHNVKDYETIVGGRITVTEVPNIPEQNGLFN